MTPAQAKPDPQPHPRDLAVEAAAAELIPFVNDLIGRHRLTAFEYLYIVNNLSVRQTQRLCKSERDALDAAAVRA